MFTITKQNILHRSIRTPDIFDFSFPTGVPPAPQPRENKLILQEKSIKKHVDLFKECFPGIDIEYIENEIAKHVKEPNFQTKLMDSLLDMDGKYPKTDLSKQSNSSVRTRDFTNTSIAVSDSYQRLAQTFILNEYRYLPEIFLKSQLQLFNFHILPCFEYLSKNLQIFTNYAILDGEKIDILDYPRELLSFLPCSDGIFYEEYKTLLNEKVEAEKEYQKELQKEVQLSVALVTGRQIVECPICYNSCFESELHQCTRGHTCCIRCVCSNIVSGLGIQRTNKQCIAETDCDGIYPTYQLKKILPERVLKRFLEVEEHESLLTAHIKGFERCPFCDWGMVIEDKNEPEFHCKRPTCGRITCRKCKKDSHLPFLCAAEVEESEEALWKYVEEKADEARIRHCPHCGVPVVKVKGCNHIACVCGNHFCYLCSKILPASNIYGHFNRGDGTGCAMYTDSLADDSKRVKEAAYKAKEEWMMMHPRCTHIKLLIEDVLKIEEKEGND
ncbi:putative E3 ubiquitin-protein ligase RNF216 [Monocercomonoides exilis]|uniref:putative E3 ubiquitin-protein ligase RNF216 n=1 Tax=Monocercomonoides exilis TaxID=2049356 RepID=UPI00355ACCEF|nr:putative E3 ubiquitin-protein ligase RNF216 [Monocercomonoides exilis]|eukprot:MONOS_469.1-p1 / transcript=MONOS_469.1 / gene=MONOS_469 / organism=Monocercomonoides_exilis_PA203 / gene_product=E3 ubiquitin-protein ligase RNF216 / transcript_product=E3 ubiquitin-protein ligase RNF216 / location=Mono_scaffold00007:210446-211945(+) / protein_length=499 / sequence_SO=supercontig / SO=protein_coding / is_pseudo=false